MKLVEILQVLWSGFQVSMLIFFATLIFALPLGLGLCLLMRSKNGLLKKASRTLIWVIRGTPLMLQLIVIFYGPLLLGLSLSFSRFNAVIVAFSINYAAYFAEIFRGGLDSIDVGQRHACKVLGIGKVQCFFYVLLPQMFKRSLPALGNECMTLVKDTALARIISVSEIIMKAQDMMASGTILPLMLSGLFYLAFNGLLTIGFAKLEKRMAYFT